MGKDVVSLHVLELALCNLVLRRLLRLRLHASCRLGISGARGVPGAAALVPVLGGGLLRLLVRPSKDAVVLRAAPGLGSPGRGLGAPVPVPHGRHGGAAANATQRMA